jgi:hypothetical protein
MELFSVFCRIKYRIGTAVHFALASYLCTYSYALLGNLVRHPQHDTV